MESNTPESLVSLTLIAEEFSPLRLRLQYEFADGAIGHSNNIVESPLRSRLLRDLLPRWPDQRTPDEESIGEFEAIIGCVQRALVHQDDHSYSVAIQLPSGIAPISSITRVNPPRFNLQVFADKESQVHLQLSPHAQALRVAPCVAYNSTSGDLIINVHAETVHAFSLLQIEIKRAHDAEFAIDRVQAFADQFSEQIERLEFQPQLQNLDAREFGKKIRVEPSGVHFEWETASGKLMGFSRAPLQITHLAQEGFESLFSAPVLKESDFLVVRHRGFFLYCLATIYHVKCFQSDLKDRTVSSLDKLRERLYLEAPGILRMEGRHLSELCSTNIFETIDRYLTETCTPASLGPSPVIFREEQGYRINNFHEITEPVFAVLLRTWCETTLPDTYSKPRAEPPPLWLRAQNPLQFSKSDDDRTWFPTTQPSSQIKLPERVWLALQERFSFQLEFEGRKVELLTADNFRSSFQLQSGSGLDWFELNPSIFLNDRELQISDLGQLFETGTIEQDGILYQVNWSGLPQLEALRSFWARIFQGTQKSGGAGKKTVFRLEKHEILELLALKALGVDVEGGPDWQSVSKFYDTLDSRPAEIITPKNVTASLKPYQSVGYQWLHDLYSLRLGGILADDMGLGKTLQALTFLAELHERGQLGKVLVVVPTSLIHNWMHEVKKFVPDLPIAEFTSKGKHKIIESLRADESRLVFITYGLLMEHFALLQTLPWHIAIFDEAQYLKTITASRTACARQLKAQFKLCLTGTPLENHFGELYSLIDLVLPGALGDLASFRKRYIKSDHPKPADLRFLRQKIRPIVLRRSKSSILKELPPKTEIVQRIPFSPEQRKIYRNIALAVNDKVQQAIRMSGENKSQVEMLTALLRLRQVCSDPASVPGVHFPEVPPKVELLVDTLESIVESGESALVFTQFLSTFDRISHQLRDAKIPHFKLSGSMAIKNRKETIEQFTNHESGAVFLSTLKSGGTGLNLTKATYVFHVEPWWNPAVENQATDRTYRIGQSKPVTVYRYVMEESVEEKIEILKQRKAERFASLFSDAHPQESSGQADSLASGSALTRDDFEYLLNLNSLDSPQDAENGAEAEEF